MECNKVRTDKTHNYIITNKKSIEGQIDNIYTYASLLLPIYSFIYII